eukprot:5600455-Pleurochrysis_carterae.AAC.1
MSRKRRSFVLRSSQRDAYFGERLIRSSLARQGTSSRRSTQRYELCARTRARLRAVANGRKSRAP